MWAIVWEPNKAIDIEKWIICGGGPLESIYCTYIHRHGSIRVILVHSLFMRFHMQRNMMLQKGDFPKENTAMKISMWMNGISLLPIPEVILGRVPTCDRCLFHHFNAPENKKSEVKHRFRGSPNTQALHNSMEQLCNYKESPPYLDFAQQYVTTM